MVDPCNHIVHLHGGDAAALRERAGRFLGQGLAAGEAALIIASPPHADALVCQLSKDGHDPIGSIRSGRLALVDAGAMLAEMMPAGSLDRDAFMRSVGGALSALRVRSGASRVRAYGEMVGILWQAGRYRDAAVLEDYWNELLKEEDLSLFCGYAIDLLDANLDIEALRPLLAAHTVMESSGPALQAALAHGIASVLGVPVPHAELRPGWGPASGPEALALWLREAHPTRAAEVLDRARRYQSSQLRAG